MKLNLLAESVVGKIRSIARPLLHRLPKKKRLHSIRVAKRLLKAGACRDTIHAGLAHDYLERGGDKPGLERHIDRHELSDKVLRIVQVLTNDEKETESDPDDSPVNPPLEHLKAAINLPETTEEVKNLALLVKLSDRIDNVIKRLKRDGQLASAYSKKSLDIANFANMNYTGDQSPFRRLYRKLISLLRPAAVGA